MMIDQPMGVVLGSAYDACLLLLHYIIGVSLFHPSSVGGGAIHWQFGWGPMPHGTDLPMIWVLCFMAVLVTRAFTQMFPAAARVPSGRS